MSTSRIMDGLVQMEGGAEEVIMLRRQLVVLDKQRQDGRMALSALKQPSSSKTVPMWFGNMFIHMPETKVKEILNKDMESLKRDLQDTRERLHSKVAQFQDMEFKPEWSGFNLKSLDANEIGAVLEGNSSGD